MKRINLIIVSLILICSLVYVYKNIHTKGMIVGTYINYNFNCLPIVADIPHVADTLILSKDGKFNNSYWGKGDYEITRSLGGTKKSDFFDNLFEKQESIISNINKSDRPVYIEINECLKHIASELREKILSKDSLFFSYNKINILSSIDEETGFFGGVIWSSNKRYYFELGHSTNDLDKFYFIEGDNCFIKEYSAIILECESMDIQYRNPEIAEVEGGLYFLFSRIHDNAISSFAFQEW
ncbi:MAG: hypothetical protein WBG43_12245 [Marinifilaceae bacterium]